MATYKRWRQELAEIDGRLVACYRRGALRVVRNFLRAVPGNKADWVCIAYASPAACRAAGKGIPAEVVSVSSLCTTYTGDALRSAENLMGLDRSGLSRAVTMRTLERFTRDHYTDVERLELGALPRAYVMERLEKRRKGDPWIRG